MFSIPAAVLSVFIAACLVLAALGRRQGQQTGLMVGRAIPSFSWTLSSGEKSGIDELKGRVILAHFWANWCFPCLEEMPYLAQLERSLTARDFSLLAFHVDPVRSHQLNTLPLNLYPKTLVLDFDREILDLLDISAIPISLLIDKKGTVRRTFSGPQAWQSTSFIEMIEALMSEEENSLASL